MQRLEFANKKSTSKNQKTEPIEELENKRQGHGWNIALTRNVFRILNSDTFYCQSESTDVYYFVRFNPSVLEWCSCRDNSTRGMKCKHLWSIEFAIRFGTLKDTDILPADAKRDTSMLVSPKPSQIATIQAKSYTEDDYSF